MTPRVAAVAIVLIAAAAGVLTRTASVRQSATFDEIVLVAGGVRGLERGNWDMVVDQPPLMMRLYGTAAVREGDAIPPEDRVWTTNVGRWDYARAFFFELGNDPEVVLGRARLVTTFLAILLVGVTAAFAWWIAGPTAGLIAAIATALTPDVLAHGGIAYNDLPLALTFVLAVWALDVGIRRPSVVTAILAALAVVAAFGTKMSALALIPIAGALFVLEAWARWRAENAEEWVRKMIVATLVLAATSYVAFVALYGGDSSLTLLRYNFWRTIRHASGGHEAPAFLFGQTSMEGWWYYFPVAFFFKTPVGLQGLMLIAIGALARSWVKTEREMLRTLAAWRGRAALIAAVIFGVFLMRSDLNIGFRYALPALPLLIVIAAAGWTRIAASTEGEQGSTGGALARTRTAGVMVAVLLSAQGLSVLSFYPHFIAYSSTWTLGRGNAHRILSDSNIDWGQGLLELRDFMEREGVQSVNLSYFGSARPEAYDIEYVALPSFLRLELARTPNAEVRPRFTVISANNLEGHYLGGVYPSGYRDREPYAVLGHALFVYDDAP